MNTFFNIFNVKTFLLQLNKRKNCYMVKAELLNKLYELTDTTIIIIRVQWNLYNAIAFKCKM